jgi:hypothetical protein
VLNEVVLLGRAAEESLNKRVHEEEGAELYVACG